MFVRGSWFVAAVLALGVSATHAQEEVIDVEVQLREAETRLEEAARLVSELSSRRLQSLPSSVWSTRTADRGAALGISIGGNDDRAGPVEGVEVMAVSPGGAAADAGLRAGDVLTAVNGELLGAETRGAANERLLDFMSGVEEGDVIDVEYLRAGKSATLEVAPRSMASQVFAFGGPGQELRFGAGGLPLSSLNETIAVFDARGWGDMEMVELTDELGQYFGTAEGLLVVRAPKNEAYQLKDGDVILDIDGRKPTSVSHAIRILDSYQHGEKLSLRIMREQRARTLEIEVPDNRRGAIRGRRGPGIEPSPRIERRVIVRPVRDSERL